MGRLYHGSSRAHHELDGSDPGYSGSLGYGLYLTSDRRFARTFGPVVMEVESPVPDNLVAHIEPQLIDCGDSLVIGTPGSSPFTFVMEDKDTGKDHKFSVLGDCAEFVKAEMMAQAVRSVKVPTLEEVAPDLDTRARRLVSAGMKVILKQVSSGETDTVWADEVLDEVIGDNDVDGVDEESVENALTDFAEELIERAEAWIAEALGTEIDLDDLTNEMSGLGYSALWIDGYALGGDEYIIFNDDFLPLVVHD